MIGKIDITLSPELRTLINAVRYGVGHAALEQPANVDAKKLLTLTKFHGVIPWVEAYADTNPTFTPLFGELARLQQLLRIRSQLQAKARAELCQQLSDAQIDYAILKGDSITHHFYRGMSSLRFADDVDLLVDSHDMVVVNKLLQSLGYTAEACVDADELVQFVAKYAAWYRWRDLAFTQGGGQGLAKLDVHWRIADSFTLPMDTVTLLANTQECDINDGRFKGLPFDVLFVHVCVHAHSDYFFRLRYLVDVYCAMRQPQFNVSQILALAGHYGVAQHVRDAMDAAYAMFEPERCDHSDYAMKVLQGYQQADGMPKRSHHNQASWSTGDKWRYLLHQIRHRSHLSPWYAPIWARLKYNEDGAVQCMRSFVASPLLNYAVVSLGRLLLASSKKRR